MKTLASESFSAPSAEWCAANIGYIGRCIAWVDKRRAPVEPETLDKMLAALAATTAFEAGESAETWEVIRKEYRRLLGGYSAHVWVEAIDAHRRTNSFFPSIAQLETLMRPAQDRLGIAAARLRKMQAKPNGMTPAQRYGELTPEQKADLDAMVRQTYQALAGAGGDRAGPEAAWCPSATASPASSPAAPTRRSNRPASA